MQPVDIVENVHEPIKETPKIVVEEPVPKV